MSEITEDDRNEIAQEVLNDENRNKLLESLNNQIKEINTKMDEALFWKEDETEIPENIKKAIGKELDAYLKNDDAKQRLFGPIRAQVEAGFQKVENNLPSEDSLNYLSNKLKEVEVDKLAAGQLLALSEKWLNDIKSKASSFEIKLNDAEGQLKKSSRSGELIVMIRVLLIINIILFMGVIFLLVKSTVG